MTNRRTLLLLLAAVLLIAVVVTNLRKPPEPETPGFTKVVVARQDIEPYSIISPSQVGLGSEEIPEADARTYYQTPEGVSGLMSTRFIKAGQKIRLLDADSIENVRYVEDMGLEIVSFPAVFNEMVAGQVRPGHKVNIYGYQRRTGEGNVGDLVLVASRVWVVDVRTAGGDPISEEEEASQQQAGGFLSVPRAGTGAQPASVLTVAAAPEMVQDIIRAFGAAGYTAWVTLAPSSESVKTPVATPTPTALPTAIPTATSLTSASTPTSGAGQTTSSLSGTIHMSDERNGASLDVFPNSIGMIWAVVDLQYSPAEAIPIEIYIDCENEEGVFAGTFTHPGPGQESYLIERGRGFGSDTKYTTVLKAKDRTFSTNWKTSGAAPMLPDTGGETPVLGDD